MSNLTFGALSTSGKVAVTAASGVAMAANARRTYASIQNTSGVAMWLGLGVAAVVGEGIRVNPNQVYEFTIDSIPFVGTLHAIMASGASVDQPIQEAQQ